MQEVFARFPTRTGQPTTAGGQIFGLPSTKRTSLVQPHESKVATQDLTPLQAKALEALYIYKHATADILLRHLHLSPNSLRYLQKQLYALHPEMGKDRYTEFLSAPKSIETRFGSTPIVYTIGRQGHHYLKKQGFPVGRYRTDLRETKELTQDQLEQAIGDKHTTELPAGLRPPEFWTEGQDGQTVE